MFDSYNAESILKQVGMFWAQLTTNTKLKSRHNYNLGF